MGYGSIDQIRVRRDRRDRRRLACVLIAIIVLAVVIFGVIWRAMEWGYRGIIQNRDSEIASLKAQRDDFRDRLANLESSGTKDTQLNNPHAARIIEFIRMGERIDTDFLASNDAQNINAAYTEWSQSIEQYLGDNLGPRFAIKFRNAAPFFGSKVGMSNEGLGAWQHLKGRLSVLIEILSEINR
jgi:hypothetical protein